MTDYDRLLKLCRAHGKLWKENGGPEAMMVEDDEGATDCVKGRLQ